MRLKLFILSIFIFICSSLFAQGYYISGKVIDAKTSEPIPFATVALLDANENAIYGAMSDEEGRFEFLSVKENTYTLSASFVGFKEYRNKITPQILQRPGGVRLTLRLREDAALLSEVEVVATRTNLQMDVDKKVFVVNESALSAGVSASDILRDIPTVDVDVDGNVSLRNNENVEVFINGKSVGLTAETQGDLLEQFPAGSIEKVEIITNPSAKFSADGSAGVINIVLKKDAKPGIYGTVSAGMKYPWKGKLGAELGAGLTVTKGKWLFLTSLGFQRRTMHSTRTSEQYNFRDTDTTYIFSNGETNFVSLPFFARVGADCQITDKSRVGLSGMVSVGRNQRQENYLYKEGLGYKEYLINQSVRERWLYGKTPRDMFSFNFDFSQKLSESADLSFLASYSQNNMDNSRDYYSREKTPSAVPYEQEYNERVRRNTEFSVDFTEQLDKLSKIEAGIDITLQREQNIDSYLLKDTMNFAFKQNVFALYFMWSQTYKRFSYKLGLRGELTDPSWKYKCGIQDEQGSIPGYITPFPSIFLSYKFSEHDELQLSAIGRISRPRGWRLNPIPNVSDSSDISHGNPSLLPEESKTVELNYLHYTPKGHMYTASIYYRNTDEALDRYSWIDDDDVFNTIHVNAGMTHSLGLELVAKNKFKYVTFTTSGNFYFSKYNPFEDGVDVSFLDAKEQLTLLHCTFESRKRGSFNLKENVDFRLPADITGQFTVTYRSPRIAAQGETKQEYVMNIGLKRSFLEKRLNVSFSIRDILNSRNRTDVKIQPNFEQTTEMKRNSRTISLSASYSFGTSSKDKKGRKGMSLDDDDMFDDM